MSKNITHEYITASVKERYFIDPEAAPQVKYLNCPSSREMVGD